jgi:hypothetical protein
MIRVHFERSGNALTLQGVFVWQVKEKALRAGVNRIGK